MKIFSPILKGTTTVAQGTTNLSGSFTGSLFGTAATASYADNFTVGGTLTAQTLVVQTVTSSISFITGSTRNGSLPSNTHQFTGSVLMSGSLTVGNTATFASSTAGYGITLNHTSENLRLKMGAIAGGIINIQGEVISNSAVYPIVLNYLGGGVGIGASTSPTYKLEVSTVGGSERIRVGTLQNNNNTATFEAITTQAVSTASSGWIRANAGGTMSIGTSTYTKTGGDSGNFANLSAEVQTTAITIKSNGDVQMGSQDSTVTAILAISKDGAFNNDVSPSHLALCGISDSRKRLVLGYDTVTNYGWINAGQWGVQWTSLYLNKVSGAVYAGATRLDTLSDIRVKDNIHPITGALDKVLAMNGKKFHLLDEPEDKIRLGFIAQELQGVVDELVITSDRIQKLPNGETIENVLGLESWGSSWAALLVEAIKEQQAQIQELKSENDTLKEILQRNNIQ
jgi:hypothetical protein